jgi:CsoR family transcriptional regulator, copper-sensing transcriptional repressor
MVSAAGLDTTARTALIARLKSIEGQARGVQHMLDEDRDCQEIMDQLTALRAATHAVTMQALESLARYCLRASPDQPEAVIAELVGVVSRLLR